jgi:hypothetical protein
VLLILIIGIQAVGAAGTAWLLQLNRDDWSNRRIAVIAALPLPLMIWALCAYIFADASIATKEECGVDSCGMAMVAAIYGAISALVLFVIGLAVSVLTVRFARQANVPS